MTNGDTVQVLPSEASFLSPGYAGSSRLACELAGRLIYYIVVLNFWESRSCQHLGSLHHPGGCWATLLSINLKHCLRRWKMRAYRRIVSIRRPLKPPKTCLVGSIVACRRHGPYVGCVTVKYQRRSGTILIVLLSCTIEKINVKEHLTPICFPTPGSPKYTAFRTGWWRRSKQCCLMDQGEERLRRHRHR